MTKCYFIYIYIKNRFSCQTKLTYYTLKEKILSLACIRQQVIASRFFYFSYYFKVFFIYTLSSSFPHVTILKLKFPFLHFHFVINTSIGIFSIFFSLPSRLITKNGLTYTSGRKLELFTLKIVNKS